MYIGIDIGGTFTDIAAVHGKRVVFQHKVPTSDNVLDCVLNALDCLLTNVDHKLIKRLCISTTLITNTIVKNQLPQTSLVIMPGPGLNSETSFPVSPLVIDGYINHLGSITAAPKLSDLNGLDLKDNIAVSGKFSVRNPDNELSVLKHLESNTPNQTIVAAHNLSGKLNFIRRTNTAYYAAATKNIMRDFLDKIRQATKARDLDIPISILKADAGTIDLQHALQNTAEFIFTGPAASVLGIKALISPQDECIALDIGGTTTDISFWRLGEAILNHKGAQIQGFNTSIDTFYLHSLGLGGNSRIHINEEKIHIGPDISKDCICLGGKQLTVTDILVMMDKAELGDKELVKNYLITIGQHEQFAVAAFNVILETIATKLDDMITEINQTPVYTVADLTKPKVFSPTRIIGVGGAAAGIVPDLADKMSLQTQIPEFAPVANALGAALARPTLLASIQVNTMAGYYSLSQESVRHKADKSFNRSRAEAILLNHIKNLAKEADIDLVDEYIQVVDFEEYPVLAGYSDSGVVINMTMQIKPDILANALN